VPVTLIDLRLHPHARFEQKLPDSYNGFLYVLGGEVFVGRSATRLGAGEVGWLAEPEPSISNVAPVHITAGREGARVVLYAGERQGVAIVQHGPFVGESRADIVRLSRLYTSGNMPRISQLARQLSPDV
jgi:redox-sensitive bicupin YhaK (pirin superfamily)